MSRPYRLKWDEEARHLSSEALAKGEALSELLQRVRSKDDRVRYTSFKALMFVIDERPALLYGEWGRFVDLLHSDNAYHRDIATYLLAGLAEADVENRFERILPEYFALLDDESVMVAAHAAGNAARIVQAKPEVEPRITAKMLGVDETHHTPSRKELIKGYVIESFIQYYPHSQQKEKILEFAEKQLKSKSPRTKKMAKKFLEKAAGVGIAI
jgi:HEAT repeat protein